MSIGDDGVLTVQLPDDAAPISRQAMYQLARTVTQSAVRVTQPLPPDAKAEDGAAPPPPRPAASAYAETAGP
ncbi:hypothetical protein [Streptomyces halstedii]|uniref:hypothetical protein n=1 Tax=Streptomyces halstedii TaxID=1944 RepID=UPI001EF16940|nr:hypothetical protein [Streptomyces halstedii]